jgi:hypothetical protein
MRHSCNVMNAEVLFVNIVRRYIQMTISEKPPLGLQPRHFWLKNRIRDCILALQRIEETEDWNLYLKQSLNFANEIKYAAEEWEKYYNDNQ